MQALPREFECVIAHSIREQISYYRKKLGENRIAELNYFQRPLPVENAVRQSRELPYWTPSLSFGFGQTYKIYDLPFDRPRNRPYAHDASLTYESLRQKKKNEDFRDAIRSFSKVPKPPKTKRYEARGRPPKKKRGDDTENITTPLDESLEGTNENSNSGTANDGFQKEEIAQNGDGEPSLTNI